MIRDIVQNAGLVGFAELGLILFFFAFSLVLIKTFFLTSDEEHEAALHMPLESPGETNERSLT